MAVGMGNASSEYGTGVGMGTDVGVGTDVGTRISTATNRHRYQPFHRPVAPQTLRDRRPSLRCSMAQQ